MLTKFLLVAASAVVAVSAQSDTIAASASSSGAPPSASSIPGLTPCILACVTPAAVLNGCNSFTNVTCVCSSAQFQADALACLTQNCSPDDLASATTLQTEECSAAGIAPSGSATTTDSIPFTLASSAASSAPAGASSPASSPGSGTGTDTGSASLPTVTNPPSASTPAVSSPAASGASTAPPTTTSGSSAAGLIANSGAGAVVAAVMAAMFAL